MGQGRTCGRAGDTFGALHHLCRFRLPALARMAAVERIDAAVRAGEPDLARRWVDELAAFADATGRPWALAAVAYGHAPMTADRARPRRGRVRRARCRATDRRAGAPPTTGSDPPRLRGVAAPHPAPRRRARAPAPGPGDLQRPARRTPGRRATAGAACLGRDRPQTRRLHPGEADPDGAQGRPAGGSGPLEQGRRRPDLGLTSHGGVPPAQRVRQGGRHLTRRARPARSRLASPRSRSSPNMRKRHGRDVRRPALRFAIPRRRGAAAPAPQAGLHARATLRGAPSGVGRPPPSA